MAAKKARKKVREAKEALYRELILEAAERVFASKGYDDTRMEEVAHASGLSLQTVYSVFAGKAALYQAIHEAADAELLEFAVAASREIEEPVAALRAGVGAYTRYFMQRPDFLRLHLHEGLSWGDESPRGGSYARTEAWRSGIEMLCGLFERGVKRGVFVDRDPMLMARLMVAMQQVELAHWLEGGMQVDPDTVVGEIEAQAERAFRPPGAGAGEP